MLHWKTTNLNLIVIISNFVLYFIFQISYEKSFKSRLMDNKYFNSSNIELFFILNTLKIIWLLYFVNKY